MGQPGVHVQGVGKDGAALRSFGSQLCGWEMDADSTVNDDPANHGMVRRQGNLSATGRGFGGGAGQGRLFTIPEPTSSGS